MARVDELTENQLATYLDALESDLDELKSRQFVGGEGLSFRLTIKTPLPSFSVTIPASGVKDYLITFTPNSTTQPLAVCYVISNVVGSTVVYPDPGNVTSDAFRSWHLTIISSLGSSQSVDVTIFTLSIDDGVIGVLAL